ncbi:MAG: SusC/RagA family TonB-linked outer membrane protein [Gemmatimonadaceae bacterium]
MTAGLVVTASALSAQGAGTITGRVTTEAGAPLQAASVTVAGLGLGAYSNETGAYRIAVPANFLNGQSATITARRIGYQPKVATIRLVAGSNVAQDFQLTEAPTQLGGVLVTALGVTKEKSQVGTAVQQISSEELNTTHDANILNQLSGKVSGINITGSGTQGGSTNIVIRGSNSITGNNSPLFVVDGVVMNNQDRGGAERGGGLGGGGIDYGSNIADLNGDDIANVSVLKGPNAAALYGSRAANGVVLITTKKGGASNGKINTQITTSYTFDKPSILPTYQNSYGQGSAGDFAFLDGAGGGVHDDLDQSFGPRFRGQPIDQFTGKAQPWVARPNNIESFFNTGKTFNGTIAFSGGTERANGRLSLGTEQISGYIPNSQFQKFNGMLNLGFQVNDRLSTSANLQYINNSARDRPGVGYNTGILEQFIWFGRQVDMNALRNYRLTSGTSGGFAKDCWGGQFNWNCNFHNNPYWIQYENPEKDGRDNFLGSASATYKVADWLSFRGTTASNVFRNSTEQDIAAGNSNYADPSYNGGFAFYNDYRNENNTEGLFLANKQVSQRLALNANFGGNLRVEKFNNATTNTTGILVPGVYNVSNAAITPTLTNFKSQRKVNSVYGSGSFTWDGWWTVEGTARNDWSSTLPKGKNSYFYPSVNSSVVLSDMMPSIRNKFLSYAKVRGAYAQVGNDAAPYQLQTPFIGNPQKYAGSQLYRLSDALSNFALRPEKTTSGEGGLELGFFNGRASIDASYYNKKTTDQIINLVVSNSTGYGTRATNAGAIQNKGFEATVSVTPLDMQNSLHWSSTFNYSANKSKVLSLSNGLTTIVLGSATFGGNVEARVGEPYGSIFGVSYKRQQTPADAACVTAAGAKFSAATMCYNSGPLLTRNGLPQKGPRHILGNIQPQWTGGWSNDVRFKNFSISALVDFHMGGKLLSESNMFGNYAGVFQESLRGREVDWDNPGIVVKGIDEPTGLANTTNVTSEVYFEDGLFGLHQAHIYSATYVKLRELRFGVELPQRWSQRFNAQAMSLAFIGRNLLTHANVPNIDPEFTYSTGNAQGFEFAALPNARSLGVSLRITP